MSKTQRVRMIVPASEVRVGDFVFGADGGIVERVDRNDGQTRVQIRSPGLARVRTESYSAEVDFVVDRDAEVVELWGEEFVRVTIRAEHVTEGDILKWNGLSRAIVKDIEWPTLGGCVFVLVNCGIDRPGQSERQDRDARAIVTVLRLARYIGQEERLRIVEAAWTRQANGENHEAPKPGPSVSQQFLDSMKVEGPSAENSRLWIACLLGDVVVGDEVLTERPDRRTFFVAGKRTDLVPDHISLFDDMGVCRISGGTTYAVSRAPRAGEAKAEWHKEVKALAHRVLGENAISTTPEQRVELNAFLDSLRDAPLPPHVDAKHHLGERMNRALATVRAQCVPQNEWAHSQIEDAVVAMHASLLGVGKPVVPSAEPYATLEEASFAVYEIGFEWQPLGLHLKRLAGALRSRVMGRYVELRRRSPTDKGDPPRRLHLDRRPALGGVWVDPEDLRKAR